MVRPVSGTPIAVSGPTLETRVTLAKTNPKLPNQAPPIAVSGPILENRATFVKLENRVTLAKNKAPTPGTPSAVSGPTLENRVTFAKQPPNPPTQAPLSQFRDLQSKTA